jgi:tetratricopeptide (TPR) repeat protein
VVASSRLRDALLGILLEWQWHARRLSEGPNKKIDPAVRERLEQVIRSARRRCGGAYARWQEVIDRNDVPGLVAFAASPEALTFRAPLINGVGRDLKERSQNDAGRAFYRSAVDRYPHDIFLHYDLFGCCLGARPPDFAEALQHVAAASALRPDSSLFRLQVGTCYANLGSYDNAVAAYRKGIALSPGSAVAYEWLGSVLSKKKDHEGAVAALREAVRIRPQYLGAKVSLGRALAASGKPGEGMRTALAALREDPAKGGDPRGFLRYNVACVAAACAAGTEQAAPPEAERAAYRKQALDLLTAELAAFSELAASDRSFVHWCMENWSAEDDLSSVCDPAAVGRLPAEERGAWERLWNDVRALRDRTALPPSSPKPDR